MNSHFASRSLAGRGIRIHFDAGVALASVVPLLSIISIVSLNGRLVPGQTTQWLVVLIGCIGSPILGYTLLASFPRTISRLRHQLCDIVKGDLPNELKLVGNSLEVIALEEAVNAVLKASKQKVLVESMGAACHHIGQPAAVVSTYLEMMKEREKSPEVSEMIDKSIESASKLRRILDRMRHVTEYQATSYLDSLDDAFQANIAVI